MQFIHELSKFQAVIRSFHTEHLLGSAYHDGFFVYVLSTGFFFIDSLLNVAIQ